MQYEVYCGVDVGESDHHACALDPSGKKIHDRALPNEQADVVQVLTVLQAHGRVLVIVDQPASIGALVIAVARMLGIDVAYLPGLPMRRIADLHPGESRTDARDAYVIADTARTMPHTLRRAGTDDETLAGLSVLAGYDDDLAAQSSLTNRLRDALLHVHPALERLLGKHIARPGVIELLAHASAPAALSRLSEQAMGQTIKDGGSPRLAKTMPAQIITVLTAQTLTIPATTEFGRVIAGVAANCVTSGPSRPSWLAISRLAWRPTLLPRS